MVRGGSWNNNPDNARSSARNNNHPDNRNNNIGIRVLCSSHINIRFAAGIASRLRLAGQGSSGSMAQVNPVRTRLCRVGRIVKPGAAWLNPAAPTSDHSLTAGLLDPTAQQFADFRYLSADMRILPVTQPTPMMRKPQVQAQTIERRIRILQSLAAPRVTSALCGKDRFLAIQRGVHKALRHRGAV